MNNFMVILKNYDSLFLSVNSEKYIVEDIVTRYFILQKFKLTNQSITDFFDHFGWVTAVNTIETGAKLEDIIKCVNYISLNKINSNVIMYIS